MTSAMEQLNTLDETAFDDGSQAGLDENGQEGIEAHEAMWDYFRTGFDADAFKVRSRRSGWQAGETLNTSCPYAADIEELWPVEDWVEGLWSAFSHKSEEGFSA